MSLADGASLVFTYTYSPNAHTADSTDLSVAFTNGNLNGTNTPQTVPVTLSGRGVGPVYSSTAAPGSTIAFSEILVGDTATETLQVSNTTTDNVGDPSSPLTRLTLNSYTITGSGASSFTLVGFTPGMTLNAGDSVGLDVAFTPVSNGEISASLRIFTDEGVVLGGNGAFFDYSLQALGLLVPEPSTLVILLFGVAGVLACKRRRPSR